MIYGNMILENQYNNLIKSDIEIIQEYYNNEISFLESIIDFKNESSNITESTDLESLHEGFLETIKNKIKELIQKFLDWCKKLIRLIKDKFFKNNINIDLTDSLNKMNEDLKMHMKEKFDEADRYMKEKFDKTNSSKSKENKSNKIEKIKYKVFKEDFYPKILYKQEYLFTIANNIYKPINTILNMSIKDDENATGLKKFNDGEIKHQLNKMNNIKLPEIEDFIVEKTMILDSNSYNKISKEYKYTERKCKDLIDNINIEYQRYYDNLYKVRKKLEKNIKSDTSESEGYEVLYKSVNECIMVLKNIPGKFLPVVNKILRLNKLFTTNYIIIEE